MKPTTIYAQPFKRWPGTWDSWGHPYCTVFDSPSAQATMARLRTSFGGKHRIEVKNVDGETVLTHEPPTTNHQPQEPTR